MTGEIQENARHPTVARYAVGGKDVPAIGDTVGLADLIHRSLLSKYRGERADPVFSGRDSSGAPLKRPHMHCHVLCEANNAGDHVITHATLYARMGFCPRACRIIGSLERVWNGSRGSVHLSLQGIGREDGFPESSLMGRPCLHWHSLTPFVSGRHPKTHRDGRPKVDRSNRWIGSPEHELARLLSLWGYPEPARVARRPPAGRGRELPDAGMFRIRRKRSEEALSLQPPILFQISFPEPVSGPIALGHASHFGLGLFHRCPEGEDGGSAAPDPGRPAPPAGRS